MHGAWERGWQSQLLSDQWHHCLYWWVCCSGSEQLWILTQLSISCLYRAFCRPTYTYITTSTKGAVPTCGLWQKYRISGTGGIKSQIYTWSLKGGAKIVPCSCVHDVYGTDQSTPEFYHKAQVVPHSGILRHALSNRKKTKASTESLASVDNHPALWNQCSISNACCTFSNSNMDKCSSLSLSQLVCCLATHCHTHYHHDHSNWQLYTIRC